jgi:hypothetical protein
MIGIERGKYLGKRLGDPPKNEAEHFIHCPACADHANSRRIYRKFYRCVGTLETSSPLMRL